MLIVTIQNPLNTSAVESVWSLCIFTCAGRPFHNRHPEYIKLFFKYSVLGLGGTKQPAVDDLRLTFVSKTSFLRVKSSEIYYGVKL